jgi:peptide/nickel transport system permease protein
MAMESTTTASDVLSANADGQAARRRIVNGELAIRHRSRSRAMLRAFSQDKAAVGAAIVILIVVLISILAPLIAPYDPTEADPTLRLKGIGTDGHLLGLDYQGRDMLSRLMWGGRVTLPAALTPVIIAGLIGLSLGLIAGYGGGLLDMGIMRIVDVLFAVPDVILAIAIAAAMGPGFSSVVTATTLVIIAPLTRMAYSATRTQREADYVLAARSIGAPFTSIVRRHLLPNVMAPVIIYASTIVGLMVVFTSTLSFLGLGVSPPTSEWGLMIDEGRKVMNVSPHAAWIPGLMIGIVSLCFNLIGDGLRYALDPRQHRH